MSELFVRPDHHDKKIGTALLDEIVRLAQARGCGRLQLENMRHKPSYQRGFYSKRGWREREFAANFVLDLSEVKG